MRAARKSWKTYALGIVAVAALLSSTACEPDDTDDSKGSKAGSTGGKAGVSQDSGGSDKSGRQDDGNADDSAPVGEITIPACTDANISITATVERQDDRHLFLTATNTGDKDCTLYHYPNVRFADGPVDEVGPMESKPQAVATVGPNEKAYTGLLLYRVGEKLHAVESLTVGFQNRVSTGDAGGPLEVPLPDAVDFLEIGTNPQVTYWNGDLDAVQDFTFAR